MTPKKLKSLITDTHKAYRHVAVIRVNENGELVNENRAYPSILSPFTDGRERIALSKAQQVEAKKIIAELK